MGVLDEPYKQLTPLSGVAVQDRQSTWLETVSIAAWRAVWLLRWAGLAE